MNGRIEENEMLEQIMSTMTVIRASSLERLSMNSLCCPSELIGLHPVTRTALRVPAAYPIPLSRDIHNN